jgi:hypothetical protein
MERRSAIAKGMNETSSDARDLRSEEDEEAIEGLARLHGREAHNWVPSSTRLKTSLQLCARLSGSAAV